MEPTKYRGIDRRQFIAGLSMMAVGLPLGAATSRRGMEEHLPESDFSRKLVPVGRALEMEGYYVWCNSPIIGDDGKTHVFFSRWDAKRGMSGWINGCEIAHAVADNPMSTFQLVGPVLTPRGAGYWDATTCHNPLIKRVGDQYFLFYMGNANGKTNTKRIGLATADSLYGPWKRKDIPLLDVGAEGAWDDHCTTNPAFVENEDGTFSLYYKSWNTYEYEHYTDPAIRGNRKYGVAFSNSADGPYHKYEHNPVIDFSSKGDNRQFEDAFVWREGGVFYMIARDMGVFNHDVGIIMSSPNGINWSEPQIAYKSLSAYVDEPPAPAHLKRYGRLERPMLLLENKKPAWLFCAAQGGKYRTSSAFVFKCDE
ncbi:glycoside hydrolase family protein [Parapedobacter tibetensis]|uniref:glycoside hydrolase family protein n=1 Tax=Parapedobacter tibetensis TaxID=2972951 RepID=UPI00214D722C|nr:glycoside hydrolase family protein [Parapedobacter tibetensis]